MAGDGRNHFIDPLLGTDYAWDINHETEEALGKTRQITHSGSTSRKGSTVTTNTGLVKQQGADSPMVMKLKGKILKVSQLQQFINFWQLCSTQTVYYQDFAGDKYEVIITNLAPVKVGVAKNPRDQINAPYHIYDYELDMEVVTILAGPWTPVTP